MSKFFDGTARSPRSRQDAIATFSGGINCPVESFCLCWDTCPPLKEVAHPDAPKLHGQRFGRLTAIGWHADGHSRWVVRCDCGAYETRSTKALRNPQGYPNKMCSRCARIEKLKRPFTDQHP